MLAGNRIICDKLHLTPLHTAAQVRRVGPSTHPVQRRPHGGVRGRVPKHCTHPTWTSCIRCPPLQARVSRPCCSRSLTRCCNTRLIVRIPAPSGDRSRVRVRAPRAAASGKSGRGGARPRRRRWGLACSSRTGCPRPVRCNVDPRLDHQVVRANILSYTPDFLLHCKSWMSAASSAEVSKIG